jgi:GNAT superfamily N-acetyltransferase
VTPEGHASHGLRLAERLATTFLRRWLEGIPGEELMPRTDFVVGCHRERHFVDFLNTAQFLHRDQLAVLPEVLGWYAERGVRPWVETFEDLADTLEPMGFQRHGSVTAWHGPIRVDTRPDGDGVTVEQVDRSALDLLATLMTRGHGIPEEALAVVRTDIETWPDQPGWRLYTAHVDAQPAGFGVLATDGDAAYLANAATVPESRGRGAQTALIRRRLRDAAAADCREVVALAMPGPSGRNMERAGLSLVGTSTNWHLGGAAAPEVSPGAPPPG